jgi:hypothetical protein
MAQISKNGITLDAYREGNVIRYRVLDQSKEATTALKFMVHVTDNETGYSLRSNKKPSFNRNQKRFFIRGDDKKEHNKEVVAEFNSSAEAQRAYQALERLLDKVKLPDFEPVQDHEVVLGEARVHKGGTNHYRMCILTERMARHLQLTGNKLWPKDGPAEWVPCKPLLERNQHFNEHSVQMCDVMNKSIMSAAEYKRQGLDDGVVNPHKVTRDQAIAAKALIKKMFAEAEREGCLVAFWRLATALRSTDDQPPR